MEKWNNYEIVSSSFRDPSGFLFLKDGILYRQINVLYKDNYEELVKSGAYNALVSADLLIHHKEANIEAPQPEIAYKVIQPEIIPFISYPYEWSFSQLKHAALTTLKIQKIALDYGISLKDCSAYNIQFRRGKPVFIDTCSFEEYEEGKPWVAYRQFCQHFLAPLALMSYKDVRLNQLSRIYMDGIPLDLVSSLLPWTTRFSLLLLSHIHLHARSQKQYEGKSINIKNRRLSRLGFTGIIDSLESAIKNMKWHPRGTEWAEYYKNTNYSPNAFDHKKQIVSDYIAIANPDTVWDLGGNVGIFSRLASDRGISTVSFDIDPAAVEKNYLDCVDRKETNLLPLLVDLNNPSPGIGWGNKERSALINRGKADLIMALALVHHLAISNNVPFAKIAEFMNRICDSLIIEFIPKHDSQVRRLLSTREDIFAGYTRAVFEKEFSKYFTIEKCTAINESERILYLMSSCN